MGSVHRSLLLKRISLTHITNYTKTNNTRNPISTRSYAFPIHFANHRRSAAPCRQIYNNAAARNRTKTGKNHLAARQQPFSAASSNRKFIPPNFPRDIIARSPDSRIYIHIYTHRQLSHFLCVFLFLKRSCASVRIHNTRHCIYLTLDRHSSVCDAIPAGAPYLLLNPLRVTRYYIRTASCRLKNS